MKKFTKHLAVFTVILSLFVLPTQAFNNTTSDEASAAISQNVISINAADAKSLAALKGIGLKKAQSIIEYREANGKFQSLDDLLKVKGIGQSILDKNRARLSI